MNVPIAHDSRYFCLFFLEIRLVSWLKTSANCFYWNALFNKTKNKTQFSNVSSILENWLELYFMQIQKYVYILLLQVPSTSFKDLNLPSTPIISKIFVRNIHSIAFQQLNFLNEKYLSTFIIKNVTIIKCNKLSIRCYLLSLSLSPQPKLLSFTQKVFRSFFSPPFSVWKFV